MYPLTGADLDIESMQRARWHIDFLARDDDQYPFCGVPFITLGAIYQQALRNYIDQAFSDLITAAQYSAGRIATVD